VEEREKSLNIFLHQLFQLTRRNPLRFLSSAVAAATKASFSLISLPSKTGVEGRGRRNHFHPRGGDECRRKVRERDAKASPNGRKVGWNALAATEKRRKVFGDCAFFALLANERVMPIINVEVSRFIMSKRDELHKWLWT
jgi:hypothetical protein